MKIKTLVRCVCGTLTRAVINHDVCSNSKCGFILAEGWGCRTVDESIGLSDR